MTTYFCTTCECERSEDEVYEHREFSTDPQRMESFTECRTCNETVEEVERCTNQQ